MVHLNVNSLELAPELERFEGFMFDHQVLEIRDSKARAIKSKRDTFRELQIVDYT